MKFLADENIGLEVITPLRNVGFDVKSILEISPGSNDSEVLNLANKEERILITADKDFGELVFARNMVHAGVILLRLKEDSSKNKLKALQSVLQEHAKELNGAFTVVKDDKIRIGKN